MPSFGHQLKINFIFVREILSNLISLEYEMSSCTDMKYISSDLFMLSWKFICESAKAYVMSKIVYIVSVGLSWFVLQMAYKMFV